MQIIFRVIFKKLFNLVSKEENMTKLTVMFIKFFYGVAKEAKDNKAKSN